MERDRESTRPWHAPTGGSGENEAGTVLAASLAFVLPIPMWLANNWGGRVSRDFAVILWDVVG